MYIIILAVSCLSLLKINNSGVDNVAANNLINQLGLLVHLST